jgi:hypothetical protein
MIDWSSLIAALIGAAIPGTLVYLKQGHDRRAVDAEVLGGVNHLLMDLDPRRALVNRSSDPDVARNFIGRIQDQEAQLSRQLMTIAAGHPRKRVRELAFKMHVALYNSRTASTALLVDRDDFRPDKSTWLEQARHDHDEATAVCAELIAASNRSALSLRRRRDLVKAGRTPA